ncbi:MAG TPA: hypothetical protein VFQ37_09375 [Mycobacterium sp.]|nr:hypothetical protein [Mycobacterium sp.]
MVFSKDLELGRVDRAGRLRPLPPKQRLTYSADREPDDTPESSMTRIGFTLATLMAAGAAALVMMAPHAVAESDPLNTSHPLQPVIDQLLDAQQQVTDTNSNYPFILPSDLPMLHEYTQNLALTMLAMQLRMLSVDQFDDVTLPWAPYPWSAPATNPQEFLVYVNPDDQYGNLLVDPNQTYVITVHPGPGTQDVTFTPNSGDGVTSDFNALPGGIDLENATPNPDGSYTITLSSTPQPGNWVDTAGAETVLVRDTVGDWGQIHDSFAVQEVGGSSTLTLPLLSDDQISSTLGIVVANMPTENAAGTYLGEQQVFGTIGNNTFLPVQETGNAIPGPTLPGQLSSLGHFSLQPDQALIVKVPDIDAAYSGLQLANNWGQTAPYATVQGSLNNTQAFHDPDGFTYYVISSHDPGVANWVDDSGINNGGIFLRWQGVTGPVPTTPVRAEVVNVADVRNDLPADTPLVTPAERAADLQQRLFEYDYVHDQNHGVSWLGANLEYDQVSAALGADQFNAIFGGQQDVPSVADRLTPALSPNPVSIAHDVLTNPAGSLSAIINNLPLAVKDIELPIILAALRLQEVVEQTVQAVQTDISSGDLWQLLAALGTGVQGLATVFNETFTDPATSITAGILNARDDLAVAVMNAPSSFASPGESAPLWDSLLQLNLVVLQTLTHTAPADIAALGADLAPNAGGLPLDLLP